MWKTLIIVLSGATLIGFSVNITIPKKAPRRTARRKETITPVFHESIITQPTVSVKKEKISDTAAVLQKEIIDEQ